MNKLSLERLIDFILSLRLDQISANAKDRAKWNILDTLGAIIAGGQEDELVKLIRHFRTDGALVSTAFVDDYPKVGEMVAAFVNGMAGTSLEVDPGHRYAVGHPSIHVLPAILALAEKEQRSGSDLLLSYLIGYEVASRIGIACSLRPLFHPHGIFGTVGAAVSCAHLGGADENLIRQSINISCSFAVTNSWQNAFQGSSARNACAGMSGHFGILAWRMALSGSTGSDGALSETFGRLLGEGFSYGKLLEGLGNTLEIERYYTKLYACCGSIHPSLDAVNEIRKRRNVDPGQISRIIVRTFFPTSTFSAKDPVNPMASRFSLPYAIAVLLFFGECMPSSFSLEGLKNPHILALAKKVEVFEDPSFTERLPEERCSRVEIIFQDGTSETAFRTDHRGSYMEPHSNEEIENKFLRLTEPSFGREEASALVKDILDIEKIENISSLTARMRGYFSNQRS
jgi:2-methylcitrate dehydratase PrpD